MLTIATLNVNGIRAAYRKGMADWLAERDPDVLLLQEVRAPDEVVADLLGEEWHLAHQACDIKGRAGVAIASRRPPEAVRLGLLNGEEAVDTGRWVEMDLAGPQRPLTVVSVYIHSGTATDEEKMAAKYAHLNKATTRMAELAQQAHAGERDVVIGGDLNIVHRPLDIKNWKSNHNKTSGVLDEEIAYLDNWFDSQGWIDVHRQLAGQMQGPYTWWSQRGKAFDNDAGWRIDYQLANAALAARATAADVDRAPAYDQRFSDHAPLVITYGNGQSS